MDMPDTGKELAALIKAQARTASSAKPAPLEHVAARVVRIEAFNNRGTGASGHQVAIDEPAQFGGGGAAVDPAELMLIAIGASLSVTMTVHATLGEIPLTDVAISLRGTLDAGRFFAPSAAPGAGFSDLIIDIAIDSPATLDTLESLVATALQASPVLRSIEGKPTVNLTLGRHNA
jgi:uncharacterized OsmC-like protein